MKTMMIIVILSITSGCGLKKKIVMSESKKVESRTQSDIVVSRLQSSNYRHLLDSNGLKVALKIYPKDIFRLDEDGFTGYADSLIWASNSAYIKRQTDVKSISAKDSLKSELTLSREKTKKHKEFKYRKRISFWWLIGLALALLVFSRHLWRKHLS